MIIWLPGAFSLLPHEIVVDEFRSKERLLYFRAADDDGRPVVSVWVPVEAVDMLLDDP